MEHLKALFKIKPEGLRPVRGLVAVGGMLGPIVVLALLGKSQYSLSMSFGALFVALCDPGGPYEVRVRGMALVAAFGTALTALGFGLGDEAWGLVLLAAFCVTLACGLVMKYGQHRMFAALLLNIWFLIALALPINYQLEGKPNNVGGQTLAWLIGSAFWIALTFAVWLARGRKAQPNWFPEFPTDRSPITLTRPMVLFSVLRAVAIGIAVAIAYGLHLPNADWMPVATIVAMKSDLQQTAFVAEQRLAGALLGAAVATVALLTLQNKAGLVAVILVLAAIGASIRSVNYAYYTAAIAGVVLIGLDLPHPTDLAAEARRVVFTFIGVGIAILVTVLANQLQKRTARRAEGNPSSQTGAT
jgi:uncharacterized membrane protein YccC